MGLAILNRQQKQLLDCVLRGSQKSAGTVGFKDRLTNLDYIYSLTSQHMPRAYLDYIAIALSEHSYDT
jgi:hypothetical protein